MNALEKLAACIARLDGYGAPRDDSPITVDEENSDYSTTSYELISGEEIDSTRLTLADLRDIVNTIHTDYHLNDDCGVRNALGVYDTQEDAQGAAERTVDRNGGSTHTLYVKKMTRVYYVETVATVQRSKEGNEPTH